MMIYGINPVAEALRAGRVRRIRVAQRGDRRVEEIFALDIQPTLDRFASHHLG